MAEEATSEERTEEATTQRREDFRKRGQVVQSRELASVLFIFSATLAVWGLGSFFMDQLIEVYTVSFNEFITLAAREGDIKSAMLFAFTKSVMVTAPLFAIAVVIGLTSTVLQTGVLYNEEALQFDWTKLDPIQGLQRIFSLRALVEGLKAFIKVCLVAGVAYLVLKKEIDTFPLLVTYEVQQILVYIGTIVVKLLLSIGVLMLVLAILDYGFLWWDQEKRMRMTKQEVKEEHKSREGDPLIKARIRKIQRDMASKRMMESVPKADVIVTNPTHIAVALQYSDEFPAPKLVAKGAGVIAEKIKEIARENNVPILENKPLARTIYKTLKIGHFIPRELYNAVAEVLAYVYRLKRKKVN